MDTLTHALSGALLAAVIEPARRRDGITARERMAAGFLAAAFPDIDFALRLADTLTYLNWHQGLTHSLVMAPLWAYMLAHLFARLLGETRRWRAFFLPALLGITVHIAGDVLTAYGTMLLAPLSERRFSLDFAFVIDPYLTLIFASGLGALAFFGKRALGVLAFAVAGLYVVLLATLHHRALEVGARYATSHGLVNAKITALPQPLSPFNWKVVVSDREAHHESLVNLRRGEPRSAGAEAGVLQRLAASYRPVSAARWTRHARFGTEPSDAALVRAAWHDEALADFRRFAALPAALGVARNDAVVCVSFVDLRFTLPSLPPSFKYDACRGAGGEWTLARTRGAFWID